MLPSTLTLLSLATLPALALATPVPRQSTTPGTIALPTAGTAIAPGSNFTFTYTPRAGYGVSTFAYHVLLLDPATMALPQNFSEPALSMDVLATGYYFGRYEYPNYPGERA